eukprot:1991296-Pyramimonas_sp.AAC.1
MSHARVAGLRVCYANVTRAGRRTAGAFRKCHTRGSQDCGCVTQTPQHARSQLRSALRAGHGRVTRGYVPIVPGSRPRVTRGYVPIVPGSRPRVTLGSRPRVTLGSRPRVTPPAPAPGLRSGHAPGSRSGYARVSPVEEVCVLEAVLAQH